MSQKSTIITTATGIENLEWLKFSFTQGMPRDLVENLMLGKQEFERYRYATTAEAVSLLQSYYNGTVNGVNNSWKQNAAQASQRFLNDFGITKVIIPINQNPSLDLDNGEYILYDMLRLSYFYCGAYGTDIDETIEPPFTIAGHVGEALNRTDHIAGQFSCGEVYGLGHQDRRYFCSLLVRESLAAPSDFSVNING
jgi:hypothetical protein